MKQKLDSVRLPLNASPSERKMVTNLIVKDNKQGLQDKALKKGLDEYRQRLESGGKTKEESEYDRQWD